MRIQLLKASTWLIFELYLGDFECAVFYRPLLVDDWFGGTIETWGLSSILGLNHWDSHNWFNIIMGG